MDFSVSCDCGRTIDVSPDLCGKTIDCVCGQQIQVPDLSKQLHSERTPSSTPLIVEHLQAMYVNGELPQEKECVRCGNPTHGFVRCIVECGQSCMTSSRKHDSIFVRLLMFMSPLGIIDTLYRADDNRKVSEAEVFLECPIRVCPLCLENLHERRRAVISLFKSNSLYLQLLQEVPHAKIEIDFRNQETIRKQSHSHPSYNNSLIADDDSYFLRSPIWFSLVAFLFAFAGIFACIDWFWFRILPFSVEELDRRLRLLLLGTTPLGIFVGCLAMRVITVSRQTIESNLLGKKKVLDRATTQFHKFATHSFTLIDSHGTEIMVERCMKREGSLYADVLDQSSLLPEQHPS